MRTINAVIFATFASVCLAACGQPDGNAPAAGSDDDRPVVALIMKSLANEFFVTMADGARAHESENADQYRLIVNGIKNEIDLAQQVALIDQMIATGVDAIVIAPADSKAMVPALSRAISAGIVVVNIDNRLDDDVLREYELNIPFVGPDNMSGAELVGDYLAERMNAGQQVAILEGVPTAYNSQQRTAGFRKAMDAAGLQVVAQQSAQWDQTAAVAVTSGILVQHPQLAAILAANDNMALGAVAAATQAGRIDQLKIVGFDNISAIRQLISDGTVLATADQHADLLATYGIEFALEALESGEIPDGVSTPVELITIDDIE